MTNLVDQSRRALGSDLNVGPLGYGCWRLVNMPVAEAQARIEHASSGYELDRHHRRIRFGSAVRLSGLPKNC